MHPCPCCGFRSLPSRGDYDLCPVCWWEDDGAEPWEISGPNGETLIEAQQRFLAETRSYRRRPGKVRRPRAGEARHPDWSPIELTPELLARAKQSEDEHRRWWEQEQRRVAREVAEDPEGPFKEFNAAMTALREKADAREMTPRECERRVRALGAEHLVGLPDFCLEHMGRTMRDPAYYRHRPLRALSWLLRHSRPRTVRRRWQELRSGTFTLAG